MSDVVIHDPRFARLIIGHAKLEKLHTGCRWAEGPAYFPAGKYLIWSDIPNDRLMRFDETDGSVSVFMSPCNHHNGHTVDRQGRLVCCEHRGRCVSRIEHDGSRVILADRWNDKRLNSPNDVVVKSDGSIWFTDPTYGIDGDYEGDAAPSEIGASYVFRIDRATGAVDAMITDRVKPNGLAFSPDERTLYVADTGRSHVPDLAVTITAYEVAADGRSVARPRVFATCPAGFFDGFRVDIHGNIWTSAGHGVFCYAPDGTHLGTIPIGEIVGNVCFGGRKRNRLYICGQTSLYALFLNTSGLAWT
ncbi:SMP-30/gluconolactonase/LRE family protein [Phreatobacter stygius]|uniref:SMP-30/gluconolactonase/LRE family protein n=1 Tax=Phreatobacter stygius TaxID=1940610 RepID=A0A4D7B505_9HYPH|nr:SMP-30/gluconolactonase/LRE family protein [Phreatobacter stygius]QCI64776.1 SMP-30/gluconolactonase/LRE family protein [Phreatobacter stygius]